MAPTRGGFSCGEPLGAWTPCICRVALAVFENTFGLALRHGRSARFPHTCGMRTRRRGHVSVAPARGGFSCGEPLVAFASRFGTMALAVCVRHTLRKCLSFGEAMKDSIYEDVSLRPTRGTLGSRHPASVGWPKEIAAASFSPWFDRGYRA